MSSKPSVFAILQSLGSPVSVTVKSGKVRKVEMLVQLGNTVEESTETVEVEMVEVTRSDFTKTYFGRPGSERTRRV